MPKIQASCPATLCKKKDAPQEDISAGVLASAGVTATWTASARRCSHCGCVYSLGGEANTIRGYFNNPVFPEGWRPIYR